jgi:hypothetical protein
MTAQVSPIRARVDTGGVLIEALLGAEEPEDMALSSAGKAPYTV